MCSIYEFAQIFQASVEELTAITTEWLETFSYVPSGSTDSSVQHGKPGIS